MFDHKQIAADWAARDFSRELWVDPPGQRWKISPMPQTSS